MDARHTDKPLASGQRLPSQRSRKELTGEYNLTFAPQKSEIREENSKLIRKKRDKKGGEVKNGKKK